MASWRSIYLSLIGNVILVTYLTFPESLPKLSFSLKQPDILTNLIPNSSEINTTNRDASLENNKINYTNDYKKAKTTPLILLLNPWPGVPNWTSGFKSIENTSLKELPICSHKCHYTFNRKLYEKTANLVVVATFSLRDDKQDLLGLTPDRIKARQDKSGQIWLGVTRESPLTQSRRGLSLDGVFNWIGTYRHGADIYWPHGRFFKQNVSRNSTVRVPKEKKKLAAWLVSNCDARSKRELLVRNLQRFIPIDVYGKCQKLKCPPKEDCRAFLGRNYKFYLAFENSLCLDYVTEKLFNNAYKNDMVPVIYAWLNDTKLLPPGSYINALDFKTPKDLADYLRYLHTHEREYLKFFEWKRNYQLVGIHNSEMLCEACAKLHRHSDVPGGHLKRHSSMLGWLISLPANTTSGVEFKFGVNSTIFTKTVCVDAGKSKEIMAWLSK